MNVPTHNRPEGSWSFGKQGQRSFLLMFLEVSTVLQWFLAHTLKPVRLRSHVTRSSVLVLNTGWCQFSQFESSGGGCADGEINLALMERRHSQQPVMDAIHHLAQTGAGTSLLLTALSPSKCPKMSPVVRSVTF